jgi:D-alanyl-D-alanine carboxypeptidase (penicillin-binding protein 5/6)
MKKTARRKAWLLLIVLVLIVGYAAWALSRPLPPLKPVNNTATLRFNTPAASLTWPAMEQSAVGIVGNDILQTHGEQKPVPTASTAKIITALMVLRAKPLALNQPGPTITLSSDDVNLYQSYAAKDGSVVLVQAGEQITEYQMLEAMLLPSANNMADSLAIWSYGSLPAYKTAATDYLKQLGLKDTTVGDDASGFSPTTTSTAQDLVKLGGLAMQNPVLAQIVGQATASNIPVVSNVKNVNSLLGTDGIIGIKTGNTNQAGGVFLAAARLNVNQKPVTVVTALMGAPTLFQAMELTKPLVQSAEANFKPIIVLRSGSILGDYRSPNGGSLPVIAARNLSIDAWNGDRLSGSVNLPPISSSSKADDIVTTFYISDPVTGYQKSVPLKLADTPVKPTLWQRLVHP